MSEGRGPLDARHAANELFGSAALVDLLILLCGDPGRRYYVNELVKLTGRFPRSVQLALARLETVGLVHSERQANARFFRIAPEHPFFPALTALVAKIPSTVDVLRAALESLPHVRVAFLRPQETDSTDLDLVVIGGDRARIEEAASGASERLGRMVRLELFSGDDWSRQAKREKSYARWLLEEPRTYVVGDDRVLRSD
ncbi:MAG TPA: helix-turn-helix domain-containing protein [Chloroflexota bacterium]|nr:helix-turn-helix domain-containing protein [Chloroflexota bacterium]